ncbi:MAG: hypothetical protein AABW99_02860 [archaeon]
MKEFFSRETLFLLTIFIIGELMGVFLHFYDTLVEFDSVMHFIGGALVSSLLVSFLLAYLKKFYFAANVLITLGIGALWEIIEYFSDTLFGTVSQGSLGDTMLDLIVVLLASATINVIYWWRYIRKSN